MRLRGAGLVRVAGLLTGIFYKENGCLVLLRMPLVLAPLAMAPYYGFEYAFDLRTDDDASATLESPVSAIVQWRGWRGIEIDANNNTWEPILAHWRANPPAGARIVSLRQLLENEPDPSKADKIGCVFDSMDAFQRASRRLYAVKPPGAFVPRSIGDDDDDALVPALHLIWQQCSSEQWYADAPRVLRKEHIRALAAVFEPPPDSMDLDVDEPPPRSHQLIAAAQTLGGAFYFRKLESPPVWRAASLEKGGDGFRAALASFVVALDAKRVSKTASAARLWMVPESCISRNFRHFGLDAFPLIENQETRATFYCGLGDRVSTTTATLHAPILYNQLDAAEYANVKRDIEETIPECCTKLGALVELVYLHEQLGVRVGGGARAKAWIAAHERTSTIIVPADYLETVHSLYTLTDIVVAEMAARGDNALRFAHVLLSDAHAYTVPQLRALLKALCTLHAKLPPGSARGVVIRGCIDLVPKTLEGVASFSAFRHLARQTSPDLLLLCDAARTRTEQLRQFTTATTALARTTLAVAPIYADYYVPAAGKPLGMRIAQSQGVRGRAPPMLQVDWDHMQRWLAVDELATLAYLMSAGYAALTVYNTLQETVDVCRIVVERIDDLVVSGRHNARELTPFWTLWD